MSDKTIESLLRLHEGVRRLPYEDSVGKLTIGVGFNLDDVGLFPEEIDFILRNRINKAQCELRDNFPVYRGLGSVRKTVLIDMIYNLGLSRLKGFKRMFAALEQRDFRRAAKEMLASKWAVQVGPRATRLSAMMEDGEWQDG